MLLGIANSHQTSLSGDNSHANSEITLSLYGIMILTQSLRAGVLTFIVSIQQNRSIQYSQIKIRRIQWEH